MVSCTTDSLVISPFSYPLVKMSDVVVHNTPAPPLGHTTWPFMCPTPGRPPCPPTVTTTRSPPPPLYTIRFITQMSPIHRHMGHARTQAPRFTIRIITQPTPTRTTPLTSTHTRPKPTTNQPRSVSVHSQTQTTPPGNIISHSQGASSPTAPGTRQTPASPPPLPPCEGTSVLCTILRALTDRQAPQGGTSIDPSGRKLGTWPVGSGALRRACVRALGGSELADSSLWRSTCPVYVPSKLQCAMERYTALLPNKLHYA